VTQSGHLGTAPYPDGNSVWTAQIRKVSARGQAPRAISSALSGALTTWADSDQRTTSAQLPRKGKGERTLESPQIESGDILSGLTAGHQIGNQLPGHGRQCQANVLVPYRIEDRGVFETTNTWKIVRKHRS
jgi:hypothetical protein